MSFSLQTAPTTSITSLVIALIASIISSILYAWLLIRFRRMEIATFKCVGYTNNNIRSIIMGEIIWVCFVAFIVTGEFLIHWTAIEVIIYSVFGLDLSNYSLFIEPLSIIVTIGLFLLAQLGGIWLAYRKILKLRPIVALRVMK
ncbi:MAG: FtsX-like permease family protein [Promethearchaeota archaeon]